MLQSGSRLYSGVWNEYKMNLLCENEYWVTWCEMHVDYCLTKQDSRTFISLELQFLDYISNCYFYA